MSKLKLVPARLIHTPNDLDCFKKEATTKLLEFSETHRCNLDAFSSILDARYAEIETALQQGYSVESEVVLSPDSLVADVNLAQSIQNAIGDSAPAAAQILAARALRGELPEAELARILTNLQVVNAAKSGPKSKTSKPPSDAKLDAPIIPPSEFLKEAFSDPDIKAICANFNKLLDQYAPTTTGKGSAKRWALKLGADDIADIRYANYLREKHGGDGYGGRDDWKQRWAEQEEADRVFDLSRKERNAELLKQDASLGTSFFKDSLGQTRVIPKSLTDPKLSKPFIDAWEQNILTQAAGIEEKLRVARSAVTQAEEELAASPSGIAGQMLRDQLGQASEALAGMSTVIAYFPFASAYLAEEFPDADPRAEWLDSLLKTQLDREAILQQAPLATETVQKIKDETAKNADAILLGLRGDKIIQAVIPPTPEALAADAALQTATALASAKDKEMLIPGAPVSETNLSPEAPVEDAAKLQQKYDLGEATREDAAFAEKLKLLPWQVSVAGQMQPFLKASLWTGEPPVAPADEDLIIGPINPDTKSPYTDSDLRQLSYKLAKCAGMDTEVTFDSVAELVLRHYKRHAAKNLEAEVKLKSTDKAITKVLQILKGEDSPIGHKHPETKKSYTHDELYGIAYKLVRFIGDAPILPDTVAYLIKQYIPSLLPTEFSQFRTATELLEESDIDLTDSAYTSMILNSESHSSETADWLLDTLIRKLHSRGNELLAEEKTILYNYLEDYIKERRAESKKLEKSDKEERTAAEAAEAAAAKEMEEVERRQQRAPDPDQEDAYYGAEGTGHGGWFLSRPTRQGLSKWAASAKLKPAYTPEQLAEKHKVSVKEIIKALDRGEKVELEHTKDRVTARHIASHHIWEFLNYYPELIKAEKHMTKGASILSDFANKFKKMLKGEKEETTK